jgi:hypothetical protein
MGSQIRCRRALNAAAVGALLLASSVVAPTAPSVSSGGPSLVPPMGLKTIWPPSGSPPSPARVGITVKVDPPPASAAKAKVQGTRNGVVTPLGQIAPGDACVFEGVFDQVDVLRADTMPPTPPSALLSISWDVRAPTTEYTGSDGTVGAGSVALTALMPNFSVYANQRDNPASPNVYRLLTVESAQGAAAPTVVSVDIGLPPLLTLAPGDWSFVGKEDVPSYTLTGQGGNGYIVYDVRAGSGPCSGTSRGLAGQTSRAFVDGTKNLVVRFTNNGPGMVNISSTVAGGTTTMTPLPPGPAPVTISGLLSQLSWTFAGEGTVGISVTGG